MKLEAILKVKSEPPHTQAGAKAVMCGPDLRRLNLDIKFDTENAGRLVPDPADRAKARWDTTNVRPGSIH